MTYDMKSEDMDKRALIQQYLNGRLNSAQIAEFTRQLKDPEFCNILSEEREIAEKRQAASQATATMAKVAEAKPLSEQEQETLIDLYVRTWTRKPKADFSIISRPTKNCKGKYCL